MIHVIATIKVAPGKRAGFLAEFHRIVPLVRAEAGCLEYGPAIDLASGISVQDPVREDVVVAVEKWESLDALKAHAAAPHMAAYGAKTKEMIANRAVHILSPA